MIDLGLSNDTCVPELLVSALSENFSIQFPESPIEYLVIEDQPKKFKRNRELQLIIETYLLCSYNIKQIIRISPIKVKNFLGLPCTGDHDKNKTMMVELIKNSETLFMGGTEYSNHEADCVGLFNQFLSNHKRISQLTNTFVLEESVI